MHDVPRWSGESACKTGICTLFEGDYHLGLAAFVNSLVQAGYAGTVWAGYRGKLPPWIHQLERLDTPGEAYLVNGQIRLVFLLLDTDYSLTNYKPQFLINLLAGEARDCEYLWYFDSDISIRCNWAFFADWQQHGIALCQELVNNILPADSPLRRKWMRAAADIGLGNPRPLNCYFSGGMVGIPAAQTDFLHTWRRFIERAEAEGCDPRAFMTGSREDAFLSADQDALNITAMYTEHPLTTMGPEAMGFVPAGFTMYHCVGPKPWKAPFVRRALAGIPPSSADKFFFTQVSSPIRAYSPLQLKIKSLSCAIAALIGRFYRRR